MKTNRLFTAAGILALVFILYVILVRTVDPAAIGPAGTVVGFSRLNGAVFAATGVHTEWYEVTQILGFAAIGIALLAFAAGGVQMILRRSIRRVDGCILLLGGLYFITLAVYFFFELVIINYRPVLMDGSLYPEASFPSSHTMISCVVMGSAMMVLPDYVSFVPLRRALQILCGAVIAVMVCGRLLSGVHWFTDVLGGVLASAVLLTAFAASVSALREAGTLRYRKNETIHK